MRAFFVLLLMAITTNAAAYSTNYWIVYDGAGNYAIGYSTGGVSTLTCMVTVSRDSTWATLMAFERVP